MVDKIYSFMSYHCRSEFTNKASIIIMLKIVLKNFGLGIFLSNYRHQ